eukprot:CFRG7826T1
MESVFEAAFEAITINNNTAQNNDIIVDDVYGVAGARILRSVLTGEECDALKKAVLQLHAGYTEISKPRRESQHHLPCRVPIKVLSGLCHRIRNYLPKHAGPANKGPLPEAGLEVSNFLRCYHYKVGQASAPHYDRSFIEHENFKTGRHMVRFSAYSVLLYLNDDFEGGHTTFFDKVPPDLIANKGFTLIDPSTRDQLKVVGYVAPRAGDILIFPHGNHRGCWPNPFHEGSPVTKGYKAIIRTDIVFNIPPPKKGIPKTQ